MSQNFYSLLENNSFVFLDGGMGTMLQAHGIKTEHVPELLNITDPEAIRYTDCMWKAVRI